MIRLQPQANTVGLGCVVNNMEENHILSTVLSQCKAEDYQETINLKQPNVGCNGLKHLKLYKSMK